MTCGKTNRVIFLWRNLRVLGGLRERKDLFSFAQPCKITRMNARATVSLGLLLLLEGLLVTGAILSCPSYDSNHSDPTYLENEQWWVAVKMAAQDSNVWKNFFYVDQDNVDTNARFVPVAVPDKEV